MTAFETVMWCGFMNEQQKVKVLWQRARNPKEGNGSNSESMDSHKLGMCNGRSRSYALCRQSTAELEDPHRVDWMCIQTLNTVLICRAAGWCLPGGAVCTSISWAPLYIPASLAVRLEPGLFKDFEGQLFATFEAKSYCPSYIFFSPCLYCNLKLHVPQGAITSWRRAVRLISGLIGLRNTTAKNQSTQTSGPIWNDISHLLSGSICLYLYGTYRLEQ